MLWSTQTHTHQDVCTQWFSYIFQRGFRKKSVIWQKPQIDTNIHKPLFVSINVPKTTCTHINVDIYIVHHLLHSPTSVCNRKWNPFIWGSKVLRVKVHRDITMWMYTLVEISHVGDTCATLPCARWGEQHSQGGPENQLPLSRGSGLATSEWQHARQPHSQAVIIWFTHNQLLIVSHWAADTCNLESSVNSQGFWQAEILCPSGNEGETRALLWLAPGRPVLLTVHTDGGSGARLLCFDSLIDSWHDWLRSCQSIHNWKQPQCMCLWIKKNFKRFFFSSLYSIVVFFLSKNDQLSGHCGISRETTLQCGTILC